MSKQELVNFIAEKADLSKKDAEAALAGFVDGVKSSLKKGDSVTLVGFGTFSVSQRGARTGPTSGTAGAAFPNSVSQPRPAGAPPSAVSF